MDNMSETERALRAIEEIRQIASGESQVANDDTGRGPHARQHQGAGMSVNEHGMPIYLDIHKGHRSGQLNFGVMTGLIQEFTLEQMQEFRQMLCVVIGIAEAAFHDGDDQRNPTAQAAAPDSTKEPE